MAKGCVEKNNRNKQCQAQLVPGTQQCVYHQRPEVEDKTVECVTVKRTKDGKSQAVALLLKSCLERRAKVRVAFANHGTGESAQKPKFHPWMYVNAVNPRPQQPFRDYGVKLSGRPSVFSHRSILVVETAVD